MVLHLNIKLKNADFWKSENRINGKLIEWVGGEWVPPESIGFVWMSLELEEERPQNVQQEQQIQLFKVLSCQKNISPG